MNEETLILKLKNAVRDSAEQQISMNRQYRKDSEDKGFYFYEANFKAILYTKLITTQGIGYEDVSLERRLVVEDSSVGLKRFDMVIDSNDEERQYAIEVKLLKRKRGLEKWISSQRKFTVYQDLTKLSEVMHEREPDRWETKGIMVIAYHGPEILEREDESEIRRAVENGLSNMPQKSISSDIPIIYFTGRNCQVKRLR